MQTGDIITLGTYPQGENREESTPIRWQVLQTEGDTALLLSVYALDYRMYHEEFRGTSWRGCTLRRWLNGAFLEEHFTPNEQALLLDTETEGDAVDKVFLLSRDQLQLLQDLKAEPTEYANIYGSYIRVPHARWWLRTRGNTPLLALGVGDDGVNIFGLGVALKSVAIRPAIRIRMT